MNLRSEVNMHRTPLFVVGVSTAMALVTAACSGISAVHDASGGGGDSTSDAAGGGGPRSQSGGGDSTSTDASGGSANRGGSGGTNAGGGGSAPATCNGYEPCGVNPVAAPDGYTISQFLGITVSNYAKNVACQDFADCDMWNEHFDAEWAPGTNEGYNRMGSPFPWALSRYIFVAPPKQITYVKLHMTSPGDLYRYSDGTPEEKTDLDTHATTCYQRGPGHLTTGMLGNMGGTGNLGVVDWNISVLPGDMGNTGNASTCQGNGNASVLITSDEATASTKKNPQGDSYYCLLREGKDYYVNIQSKGKTYTTDCSTAECTAGVFAFSNPTTSDNSPFLSQVACP